jgi:hypothetical protein
MRTKLTTKQKKEENLTIDKLLLAVIDERQTRPLLREGAPQTDSEFQTKLIFGCKSQSGLDTKTYRLTDRKS